MMQEGKRQAITLHVNGVPHQLEVSSETTLLEVLRDELRLTGTKNGCGQGHCGTCTVIVNNRAVRSCITPAHRLDGAQVETIEGLARGDELHPLQRAFIEQGAVQCGFCTPGMIMAAKALLDANPQPTREDIIKALTPNLCRCTGYASIVRAIQQVSSSRFQVSGFGEPGTLNLKPGTIGKPLPRPDARAKVTGEAIFAADLYFENMLHAKVLRSAYHHARIRRIDTSKAKALSGVAAVLTADDIPGARTHGTIRADWPTLCWDKVRYTGDALALVAAETESIAEEALKLIEVDYELLPAVFSPQEALAPGAPLVHDDTPGNLLKHIKVRKGDIEDGFAQADVVVEQEYHTPFIEHAFLEPEAGVATLTPTPPSPLPLSQNWERGRGAQGGGGEGRIIVYVGSQIPFEDRRQVAEALALPEEQVRIVQTAVGGAFGGKEDITVQIPTALLAQATGRPVKLVFSREESMRVHPKRHATTIRLKVGARQDGTLTAVQAIIWGNAGAYASLSEPVMTRTATHAAGPYQVPYVRIDCYAVYTNNPPAGAMRGFGVPQASFAMESTMDLLAEKLGLHPLELRRRNALQVGSVTATGQVLRESVGLLETIERVEAAVQELGEEALIPSVPDKRRGLGFACCLKNVGLGGGLPDTAGAAVDLTEDGSAVVRIGAAEIGQGLVVIAAQIAAEVLGVPYERVQLVVGDTARTPDGGPTTASRQTFITGNAVRYAALKIREQLTAAVAEALDVPPDALSFSEGRVTTPDGRDVSLVEAIALAQGEGRPLSAEHVYQPPATTPLGEPGDDHFAYGFATQAALVEVDTRTGRVEVLRVVAAHDVGRAINPQAIAGQLEGGVAMGMGFALSEELVVKEGVVQNANLARYRIPRIGRMPEVVPIIVEAATSEGPFGAKGVGEITSIPTAPAIINAIHAAAGARITELPATPERVRAARDQLRVLVL
jgi:CO/xanthine dehydrogenase Mo-binding subunit/aerobic-type carbon monoxide dehydrogenase small subunit (CoxS/CutS family)